MLPGVEPAEMPADAVEVARVAGAWGVKGWVRVLPHSPDPEALFSSKRWYLLPAERGTPAFAGPALVRVREAREHSGSVVANLQELADRDHAEALRGARVFVARSSFPTPQTDEYYWVDLIGLTVVNRQGLALGTVRELLSTGPQTVLVLHDEQPGADGVVKSVERMIPFVSAFVDRVDLPGRQIVVDWQPDY